MEERVAVVTGAAEGIGAEIAKLLSSTGFKVALLDINEPSLTKTVNEIKQQGRTAPHGIVCDISNRKQVFDAVDEVEQHFGHIDVLVLNAGVCHDSLMENVRVDVWLKDVDVNVVGNLHCVAAVLPGMIERKSGHIVFTSSILGVVGRPTISVYCGAKHFIQGFAAAIRQQLAPLGIKVTCIKPGLTITELSKGKDADEEIKEMINRTLPMRKGLQPQDIAKAVLFCLHQEDRVGINEITVEHSAMPELNA